MCSQILRLWLIQTDEEAVEIYCRNSMLQKLYALVKIFNKVIGREISVYNFKIIVKIRI